MILDSTGRMTAIAMTALALSACGEAAKLPQLPQLTGSVGEPMRAPGSVPEVYARIAQNSRACWFGPDGALKTTHIFHADLTPPSRGETAELVVHELDRGGESRWGRRMFRILLQPADQQTAIAVDNISMPTEIGSRMRADVFQWSQGGTGCTTRNAEPVATAQTTEPAAAKTTAPATTASTPAKGKSAPSTN